MVLPYGSVPDQPAATRNRKRELEDWEPITYWPLQIEQLDEIRSRVNAPLVMDTSVYDEDLAIMTAGNKTPYLGLAWTELHCQLLIKRCHARLFASYYELGHKDYPNIN